jgi:hypothetical protein
MNRRIFGKKATGFLAAIGAMVGVKAKGDAVEKKRPRTFSVALPEMCNSFGPRGTTVRFQVDRGSGELETMYVFIPEGETVDIDLGNLEVLGGKK